MFLRSLAWLPVGPYILPILPKHVLFFFYLGDGIAYNHGNHASKWILDLMATGRSPHGLLHVHLFRCDGQPSSPLSRMKLKISRLG